MITPIYKRKSGSEKVKLHVPVGFIREKANDITFCTLEYLSVDLHSHYYIKRKSPKGTPELWLIEFSASSKKEPPYTYKAKVLEKYRDVSEDWRQDE